MSSLPAIGRVPVRDVRPAVDCGRRPAKAVVGETFEVTATVFREGDDAVAANVVLTDPEGRHGPWTPMRELAPGSDRWGAEVTPDVEGHWTYRVEAWSDPLSTWRRTARIKVPAGIDTGLVLEEGAELHERAAAGVPRGPGQVALLAAAEVLRDDSLPVATRLAAALTPEVDAVLARYPLRELVTASDTLPLLVERERALYGAWYEFFPRSEGTAQQPHGTFRTAARRLPAIAGMGFDVVYLPPIHPIGHTFRKGRNNSLSPGPTTSACRGDRLPRGRPRRRPPGPGHPGGLRLVRGAGRAAGPGGGPRLRPAVLPRPPLGTEHPQSFRHRRDGTIAYAENPPKKYQDIYPIAFDPDLDGLIAETVRVLRHWIAHGYDLPGRQPAHQAGGVLGTGDRGRQPHRPRRDFLAEAFTRPAMMHTLAQIGFQQRTPTSPGVPPRTS
ncbi:Alpha-1,4-glucan:maltose-1-phosphate maltosyltransferase OS=Streptomyces alboniger OX=132473 GN=glgE PE=3 SV=1 [Streptomyces alboniger]